MMPSEADLAKLTPEERGRHRALLLHRYTDPRKWRAEVDAIACPVERATADNYLHGVIIRMRVAVAAKKAAK